MLLSRTKVYNTITLLISLVLGFLVCTYFGRIILMTPLGYLPEIAIFIICFGVLLFNNKLFFFSLKIAYKDKFFIILCAALCASLLISFFSHGDIKMAISHFKTTFYFAFLFVVFRKINLNRRVIEIMVLIGFIYFGSFVLYYFQFGNVSGNELMADKYRLPIFLGIFCLVGSLKLERYIWAILSSILLLYASFISNYRLYLYISVFYSSIVFLVFGYLIFLKMLKFQVKFIFKISACILILGVLLNSSYLGQKTILKELFENPQRYSQLVTKSIALFAVITEKTGSLEDKSVEKRFGNLMTLQKNMIYFIAPLGLGPTAFLDNKRSVLFLPYNTLDSGIVFSIIHFGVLFTSVISFYAVKLLRTSFRRIRRRKDKVLFLILATTIVGYYLISTDFLVITELAISSGVVLGLFFNPSFWNNVDINPAQITEQYKPNQLSYKNDFSRGVY